MNWKDNVSTQEIQDCFQDFQVPFGGSLREYIQQHMMDKIKAVWQSANSKQEFLQQLIALAKHHSHETSFSHLISSSAFPNQTTLYVMDAKDFLAKIQALRQYLPMIECLLYELPEKLQHLSVKMQLEATILPPDQFHDLHLCIRKQQQNLRQYKALHTLLTKDVKWKPTAAMVRFIWSAEAKLPFLFAKYQQYLILQQQNVQTYLQLLTAAQTAFQAAAPMPSIPSSTPAQAMPVSAPAAPIVEHEMEMDVHSNEEPVRIVIQPKPEPVCFTQSPATSSMLASVLLALQQQTEFSLLQDVEQQFET